MRNALLPALLALSIISCTKTEDPPTVAYGVTYPKTGVTENGDFRLFSKAGEIKNASLMSYHLELDSLVIASIAGNLGNTPTYYLDTIRFDDRSTAYAKLAFAPLKYTVENTGSFYTLTSVDTLTGFLGVQPISQNIYNFIPKERLIVHAEGIASINQGEYTYYHTYKDRFIVRGGNGDADLSVPFVMYVNRYANGDVVTNWIHGRLDPGFHSALGTGDTILLREYDLLYSK